MFQPSLKIPTHSDLNLPKIYVDQLAHIAWYHEIIRRDLPPLDTNNNINGEITHTMIVQGITQGQFNPKLTRNFLLHKDGWPD